MKMKRNDLSLQDNENELLRLQVFMAHCGVASRRASEKLIQDGHVTVNGNIVTELGTKVSSSDKVAVDGKLIFAEKTKRYVLLNKPQGYICSAQDDQNRPVAVDLLKEKYQERLYNVGRLDMYSKGLIIFTNDGDFAAKLSHPSFELEKEYIIETSQDIPDDFAEKFCKGIRIGDVFYKCKEAEKFKPRKLRVVLIEGKNREIRNVLEEFKIGTKSLTRVRIGSINIDDMKIGDSRDLTKEEVESLLKAKESGGKLI
ncbi:MAG: rRNA pseudouridine synthase [Treponema sp.]|nr:rRNA pseudouridine synthase [Treponema sp.]